MNIAVLDVGTSSIRMGIYDENGNCSHSMQIKYHPIYGSEGKVEQSAAEFRGCLLKLLKDMARFADRHAIRIEAISITAQRSSVIPVDKNGEPLMNAVMWQDTRNKELCDQLREWDDLIFSKSGARINTVFSGAKMMWVKHTFPDVFAHTAMFLNIPEYLMYIMTGRFASDFTYGSRSNLMNLRTCKWDPELLSLFGLSEEQLCRLHEPGSIVGYLCPDIAVETGLKQGIPVISAGGDQQCGAVGLGVWETGTASVVLGTGAYLITPCDVVPDNLLNGMICNCSSVAGKYMIETNVLTCASAFDWFCNNFFDWTEGIDYSYINQILEKVYTNHSNCVVLPYFQGRSTPVWNPSARAVFGNISIETTRADILKSLLESILIEIRGNMDRMQAFRPIQRAMISGGLTNSEIINQMQADIYGIPVVKTDNSESTSRGALLIALLSLGRIASLREGFERISALDRMKQYEPNKQKKPFYSIRQEEQESLYQKIYGGKIR